LMSGSLAPFLGSASGSHFLERLLAADGQAKSSNSSEPMGAHVFGCDICQDVCPWNNRAPTTEAAYFLPRTFPRSLEARGSSDEPGGRGGDPPHPHSLDSPDLEWLANMSEEEFREVFRKSAVKRTKWRGIVRNACIALGNARLAPASPAHDRVVSTLRRLADSVDVPIAQSAQWALSRIQPEEPKPALERDAR